MEFLVNLQQLSDFGLLVLRLAIGSTFIVHGIQKLAMWKMQPSEQMSANMLRIMRTLSIAEPLGGLAMISGFLTQLAALGLILIMIGAIYFKMNVWKKKFSEAGGWELDFLVLTASLLLFFIGAGGFSLDRILFGL